MVVVEVSQAKDGENIVARVRSPNYPNISLPAALERIRKAHAVEGQNEVDRVSFVRILGYSGLTGPSAKMLSSLTKYGLLTKTGSGEVKISDLAMDIMFGDPSEKAEAVKLAVNSPSLFAEINEKWPDRPPSNETLRSYLARKGFSINALGVAISAYRETIELVTPESPDYAATPQARKTAKPSEMNLGNPTPPPQGIPFRVTLEGDAIEVTGRLTTPEEVDKLVKILELNKVMITPVLGAFDTEYTEDEEGREAEERDRKLNETNKPEF